MFVLGVDPGLSRCGYGAVVKDASSSSSGSGSPRAVAFGLLTTPVNEPLHMRLSMLGRELRALLAELRPEVVVVERVFFQTNVRTAMSVGQASGLALAAAADAGCEVVQYTANEVKHAVTGYGGASKDQVQRMVRTLLGLPSTPRPPDAADALALALTHVAIAPLLARVPR